VCSLVFLKARVRALVGGHRETVPHGIVAEDVLVVAWARVVAAEAAGQGVLAKVAAAGLLAVDVVAEDAVRGVLAVDLLGVPHA